MKTVLFDIDYTLLNTGKLIREYVAPALCQELGVSNEQFEQFKKDYIARLPKYTDFTPEGFIASCLDAVGEAAAQPANPTSQSAPAPSLEALVNTYYTPEWYPQCLYPGVPELLQQLAPDYSLGIFSEGARHFQLKKLLLSGISGFFEDRYTYISERKLMPEMLAQLPPESIVVDDNPEVIDTLSAAGIQTIWIQRPERPMAPQHVTTWTDEITQLPELLDQ
jgi:FMN phosphatase YigB (HAD superfamily)